MFVSQSGETADTLATLRYAKEQGQHVLSIVNVPTSTIARESDVVMPTLGGAGNRRRLDQGLHLPAWLRWPALPSRPGARAACLSETDEHNLFRALVEMPRLMAEALAARAGRSNSWRAISPAARTCSISAAAPATRWRSKARSS